MLANVGKNAQIEKFWEHEMFETCCGNLFFIGTTLRRRKNPLFFDARPSGAEKIRCFLTREPSAQKKPSLCLQERRKH